MDARPTNRRPTFNKRELICVVIGSLCYVDSVVCFYVHAKRKNLAWKLKVAIAMEYSNEALFVMLLGSVCLATTLMFIAPINTDFVLLCGYTVKLAWENDKDDLFIWLRTASCHGLRVLLKLRAALDNFLTNLSRSCKLK
ncbi:hypothetical protein KY284_024610 [Solanum tuberosum]|nr:hypothetical protein KY284_024610 [Solanum tuberosum]